MSDVIAFGDRRIGPDEPVFIIGEIGLNHNGDLKLAEEMVRAAAECGVDAVKFQTFKTDLFLSKSFPGFEERKDLEFKYEWHLPLQQVANELGVEFISTPLDADSVDFLDELGVPGFKVASMDLNNYPFLEYIAKKGKPMLLSTGFSNMGEVEKAVNVITSAGNDKLILLHCVSVYPVDPGETNLRAIQTMKKAFGLNVGFSDHTKDSPVAPIVATALGARVWEKHFTTDRELPGYDHHMSETPGSFQQSINNVRSTERALGTGVKRPHELELERLSNARRSLYWKDSYASGTKITEDMLLMVRPARGMSPEDASKVLGRTLRTSVESDALVEMQHVEWSDSRA